MPDKDESILIIAVQKEYLKNKEQFKIKPDAGIIHFHFPGTDTTFSMHAGALKNILTHNMESSDLVSHVKIDWNKE